jgi:hypothetical protein
MLAIHKESLQIKMRDQVKPLTSKYSSGRGMAVLPQCRLASEASGMGVVCKSDLMSVHFLPEWGILR